MSALGVTQIAAVMGSCVAGGAYLPIMSDESLIVDKTGTIFLAGSYLVKAAVGEIIDNETLGGAKTHCEISGVTDYISKDDQSCISTIRDIIGKITTSEKLNYNKIESRKPILNIEDFYGTFPSQRSTNYDVKEILKFFVDNGDYTEYKAKYGAHYDVKDKAEYEAHFETRSEAQFEALRRHTRRTEVCYHV